MLPNLLQRGEKKNVKWDRNLHQFPVASESFNWIQLDHPNLELDTAQAEAENFRPCHGIILVRFSPWHPTGDWIWLLGFIRTLSGEGVYDIRGIISYYIIVFFFR